MSAQENHLGAPAEGEAGDVEATVYVNGTMKTRFLTVDVVTEGTTHYGRLWFDHRLSIDFTKQNVALLIEALSELDL